MNRDLREMIREEVAREVRAQLREQKLREAAGGGQLVALDSAQSRAIVQHVAHMVNTEIKPRLDALETAVTYNSDGAALDALESFRAQDTMEGLRLMGHNVGGPPEHAIGNAQTRHPKRTYGQSTFLLQ